MKFINSGLLIWVGCAIGLALMFIFGNTNILSSLFVAFLLLFGMFGMFGFVHWQHQVDKEEELDELDTRCICEMNADGEPISGYCHKHNTEYL